MLALKMELVQAELQSWGEIIIATEGGHEFEIHIGDTTFDFTNRIIKLKTPDSEFIIDGDSVESIRKHYGHRNGDD